nr:hypothetical protein GCM10020093_073420 [Planobispora longispora]
MTVSTVRTEADDLVAQFAAAPLDSVGDSYLRLVGELWHEGVAKDAALPAVPRLVSELGRADAARQGYLAVLLGLLAESEYPAVGGPLSRAVREGLDLYLDLLSRGAKDDPLTLALLYLVSHFPDDRDRILAAVAPLGLDADDLTRLERNLRHLDPEQPELGRVWPSPSVWKLTEQEREYDKASIKNLTLQQITANWQNDSRTILGYSGAKAYWAVRYGAPAAIGPEPDSYDPPPAPELGLEVFSRYGDALRCSACRGPLSFEDDHVRCGACSLRYPLARGILDLSEGVEETTFGATDSTDEATAGLLQKLAEMPSMGLYYEAVLRPAFLRIAGANWGDEVTPRRRTATSPAT